MKQFAQVDAGLIVVNVIVVPDDFNLSEVASVLPAGHRWEECFLPTQEKPEGANLNYPAIGYSFVPRTERQNPGFVMPKPTNVAATLNAETLLWEVEPA